MYQPGVNERNLRTTPPPHPATPINAHTPLNAPCLNRIIAHKEHKARKVKFGLNRITYCQAGHTGIS